MKKSFSLGIAALLLLVAGAVTAASAAVVGDYVEVRSADIYTGPCCANSEVNLEGKQAMMAWRINRGAFEGVNLDGMSVVAVVLANSTLGDEFHNPYPARSVLIVDQRATGPQRAALQALPGRWAESCSMTWCEWMRRRSSSTWASRTAALP